MAAHSGGHRAFWRPSRRRSRSGSTSSCARSSSGTSMRPSRSGRRRGSTAARATRRSRAGRSGTSSRTTRRRAPRRCSCAARALVPPGQRAARDQRLPVVARQVAAADLHQHAEGLAPEHARRLLGARSRAGALKKLGGDAPESSLMFAKFSPDGTRVAYVRAQQPLRRGSRDRRHHRSSRPTAAATTINGTSDWVYEEELDLRDGFRWSPDGRAHRVLAVRHDGRRALHAHQRHRHALSDGHAVPVSEGRHDELRGARRRRSADGGDDDVGADARAIRATSTSRAWTGSDARTLVAPAAEPAAEHERRAVRRRRAPATCDARFRDESKAWVEEMDEVRGSTAARSSLGVASATAGATPTAWRATADASGC